MPELYFIKNRPLEPEALCAKRFREQGTCLFTITTARKHFLTAPRLLTAAIYYNYLNWGTEKSRVTLVAVTVITNVLENVALLMVTFQISRK